MPTEVEHKFLLNSLPQMGDFPREHRPSFSSIEQVYLSSEPGLCERVRCRWFRPVQGTQSGRHDYIHTTKRQVGKGANDENETHLLKVAAVKLMEERADPSCVPVLKARGVFEWGGLVWEYDEFDHGLGLLEVEVPELMDGLELPPFLDVGPEVTGDALYSNAVLARISWSAGHASRPAFLKKWRGELIGALATLGITLELRESEYKEWWLEAPGNLWVRLRDSCESPEHDFHLSCWVGRGDKDDLAQLAFWHGEQGTHTPTSLAGVVVEALKTAGVLP